MGKIFLYECKRLLCNKFFIGLLLVSLFYGWQVLNRVTLFGVSHTAPFSPWSFGDYLCRMMPLLWMGALFFLTFFISKAEARRAALTAATPVKPGVYGLVRCCAALVGTVLLVFAVIVLAVTFYGNMFQWYEWQSLLFPAMITLVPSLIFALGSGWLLGHFRSWLLFVWMLLPLVMMALPMPEWLGLLDGSIFVERPLAMNTLDPAFSLPQGTIIFQCVLLLTGVVLLFLYPKNNHARSRGKKH